MIGFGAAIGKTYPASLASNERESMEGFETQEVEAIQGCVHSTKSECQQGIWPGAIDSE